MANWVAGSGGVDVADVQGGRGRLSPTTNSYSLARMVYPMACAEAEGSLEFEFTDAPTQGVGFYLRQNGGHLQLTDPPGEGYAAFAESFRTPIGLGVWREVNGDEQNLEPREPFHIASNTRYRMRFRLTQQDETTSLLQARIWSADDVEPATWLVERTDSTPSLQSAAGSVAIDAWNTMTSSTAPVLFVDNIQIRPL